MSQIRPDPIRANHGGCSPVCDCTRFARTGLDNDTLGLDGFARDPLEKVALNNLSQEVVLFTDLHLSFFGATWVQCSLEIVAGSCLFVMFADNIAATRAPGRLRIWSAVGAVQIPAPAFFIYGHFPDHKVIPWHRTF
ncbi:hypothetical protein BO86DRAFT_403361 [Aspergillus japonicus CBS 114.51]|uniref:Uncharacterized protein n=1 Tax=Aspergillus japonicus CBS 114.51 TaxID=1448312 RepID=A0A8T8WQ86_ASPJA|nr:hypothetical protein BO86DRAFT_403361 [Aspergillus japonicus CBS 114.51]RAH77833.1 hypothetical protein BO86DRAFT_403361 [Aspergillus japonicus CBS 114.51]